MLVLVLSLMNFASHFSPECDSQCSEEPSPMEVQPHVLTIGSLVPVSKSSPERRNQKEIVAGEERPKFLTINQTEDAQGRCRCRALVLIIFTKQIPLHISQHAWRFFRAQTHFSRSLRLAYIFRRFLSTHALMNHTFTKLKSRSSDDFPLCCWDVFVNIFFSIHPSINHAIYLRDIFYLVWG